jgi:hypothetical protein
VRTRFPTEHQLAAEAGVAPVTYQSGKSEGVGWRWACNKRLRAALSCMADNSRHHSLWALTLGVLIVPILEEQLVIETRLVLSKVFSEP